VEGGGVGLSTGTIFIVFVCVSSLWLPIGARGKANNTDTTGKKDAFGFSTEAGA